MRKLTISLLLTLCVGIAVAQEMPRVVARISPDSIMIGDHFSLSVEVTKDLMQVVEFPTFENKQLADSIEILLEGPIDTINRNGRNLTLKKEYLLTCFDEGVYAVGRFPVLALDKNRVDTIFSLDSLFFTVNTYSVDTVSQTIFDIKPPIHTPIKFGEFSGYLTIGYLLLLVLLLIINFIYLRKKSNNPLFGRQSPPEPPHIVAIKQLEDLHSQKLWQIGKQKEYYTQLTDILRIYIEGRYNIQAMEMTSAEILQQLKDDAITDRTINRLKDTLHTSDFVKFAKFNAEAEQNEEAFNNVYYFVEETKATQQEEAMGSDEIQTEDVQDEK